MPKGSGTKTRSGHYIDDADKRLADGTMNRGKAWSSAVRNTVHALLSQGKLIPYEDAPVCVGIVYYLPRPKNHHTGENRERPVKEWAKRMTMRNKPDIDKLHRRTWDALTKSGLIKDDSRVVAEWGVKLWADERNPPGCIIKIAATSPDDVASFACDMLGR